MDPDTTSKSAVIGEQRPAASGQWPLAAVVAALIVCSSILPGHSGQSLTPTQASGLAGTESCRPCHQRLYDRFVETAHYNTSRTAAAQSIRGSFAPGRNFLRTRDPHTYFKMEKRDDGFYQTGHEKDASGRSRTERFDLVFGSGRKGQTYLYWKDGFLYQLPVSYVTGADRWVNSPGFVDGKVHFDRPIIPRCLECHTTSFRLEGTPSKPRYADDYVLGIACETCHGLGSRHVQYHNSHPQEQQGRFIVNPARFSRDRKVDQCALCHSGIGQSRTPPFSYRPGDRLQDHLLPDRETVLAPDVHGNQIGLLRTSRCFIASGTLDCSTCHDVHRPQRNLAELSRRCVGCHVPESCGVFATAGRRIEENCIDCHMPNRPSRVISIQTDAGDLSPPYRSHAIGIYRSETGPVLRSLLRGKP